MTHDCLARNGQMCVRCTVRLGQMLRNLPELYVRLEVEIVRATPAPSERSASKEAPMPVSAANLDLLTLNVEHVKGVEAVEGWCRIVIEERSVNWPNPLDSVYGRLSVACQFLTVHLEWISAQPWCDEFAAEVGLLERALRHAVEPEPITRTRIPCPDCQRPMLRDETDPGLPAMVCRPCESRWESEAFLVLAERLDSYPVLIEDVAQHLMIPAHRIRNWVTRDLIPNHGRPGSPKVKLSEVLAMVEASKTKGVA